MKNIVLIGFMGAGKTSLLKEMIKNDSLAFMEGYDLDAEIEKRVQKKISTIIKEDGISSFREMETEVFRNLILKENIIVACGGGFIESPQNINLLQQSICVFLDAPVEILFQRIINSTIERPLVKVGLKGEYNFELFKELYKSRISLYKKNSTLHFDTNKNSSKKIISELLNFMGRNI